MNYTELLNQLVENSGKMVKDIADECNTMGVNLTSSYLSVLRSSKGRIPSTEISVALAKVCGAQYDQILVVQAYLDKSPQVMLDFFNGVRKMMELPSEDEGEDELSKQIAITQKMSMAEFICWYSEQMGIMEKAFEDEPEPEPMWLMLSPEQLKTVRFVTDKQARAILKNQE